MKPMVMPLRSARPIPTLQCRRNFYFSYSTTAPALYNVRCHDVHKSTRLRPQHSSRDLLRHASSAATALKPAPPPTPSAKPPVPAKSPSSSVPVPQVLAKLNPPPESYAPELHIPPRKPDQSYFKYLFGAGKAYITFYKQGITNVRATARLAKTIRQKVARAPASERDTVLSRAEWQIVRRSRQDMFRLPGFGALVLIFGEWLPLLALYITPMIPEPCRIPAQIQRKLQKLETRRSERERRLAIDAARLVARDRKPGITDAGIVRPQAARVEELEKMNLYSLLFLSTKLDCHSWVWDKFFMTPPKSLLKWDARRKVEYLQKDDRLIERDGGWQALEAKEVERACVERGIKVLGRSEADLRRELAAWFKR